MKDEHKTRAQLVNELVEVRQQLAELEAANTKHKQVDETLRDDEARYSLLFNSGNDAVFVYHLSPEGVPSKFVEVNDVACQRLGYTREELSELSLLDISLLEEGIDVRGNIERLLAERHVLIEATHVGKDGRRIPVEINAMLFELNGRPAVMSIARDITGRKQAEEALRDSEERYRMLVNLAPDIIYRLNEDGKIAFISPSVRQLGYDPGELVGRPFEEIVHPDDSGKATNGFVERRVSERAMKDVEIRLLAKAGEARDYAVIYRAVSLSARGLWDVPDDQIKQPDKSFLYTQGIARDITGRKRAEEALRESEARFRSVSQSAIDAIISADSQTNIVFCNASAQRMFGYTEDEMLGRPLAVLIPERFRDAHGQAMRRLRSAVESRLIGEMTEWVGLRQDGSEFSVESSLATWEAGGEAFYSAIMRDITERRQAEWALVERMKELTCLYAVHRDMQEDLSVDELGRRVVEHLVPAMQFPEITVPVIELDDRRFTSKRYTEELSHRLHADVRVGGEVRGRVWVYYAEDRPFLIPEEQNLLNSIAETLGVWLERRWAEEALRAEKERAQGYLDVAGVMIVAIDIDQKVSLINRRGAEILGCEEESIIGQNWLDNFIPESIRGEVKIVFDDLMAGRMEAVEYFENLVLTRSGEERLIAWYNTYLCDEAGNIVGTLSSGEDITERRQAEETIRYQANLVENVSDAIISTDLHFNINTRE